MNILFSTQSESLVMFDELRRALAARLPVERSGFIVADSWSYLRFLDGRPDFERQGHVILKEWEVTGDRHGKPDLGRLAQYERELGREAGLFGAIVADRRLLMGPDCTYSQDYRRRFTDDQLLRILQRGAEEVERVYDELRPDVLAGFICVTMMDYLAYLFARARGVKVLNLRPTRVGDRVLFGSRLNDPDPAFVAAYERRLGEGAGGGTDEAREYLARVREQHARYEGVIRPSDKPALRRRPGRRSPVAAVLGTLAGYRRYRSSVARRDNHVPHPLRALWFAGVANPLRARRAHRLLAQHYVPEEDLRRAKFAFYPLHTEPEVSLLVYGRPFVNQIEIVRALAMSLPVDMTLVVKEHPWMVGKRTVGAYRKMLDIPRVRFVRPGVEARSLIAQSQLVAVVTGSVALEAAILGKPVVTFGDCPYNALPPHMVRRCADPRRLPALVAELLEDYRSDERALVAYVSAVMDTSASVNLYSVLLGKQSVHAERASEYGEEVDRLARYFAECVQRRAEDGPVATAAPW